MCLASSNALSLVYVNFGRLEDGENDMILYITFTCNIEIKANLNLN